MTLFSSRLSTAILLLSIVTSASLQGICRQQTAAATSSAELESHLGQAYDALKQDRYQVAASEFRAALAIDPTLTLRARFPLAASLFELHEFEEARKELEIVRKEVGEHPNVLYYLGRLDLESRNYAGAIENLRKAVAKPPFPDTSYYLGFAYFKQGALQDAEKWLKEASKTSPLDSRVPYQLALVYRKQGLETQAKEALALSEKLRQKRDDDSKLKAECGQKLEQGPREEAHALCDQLYDADSADRLTALGTIYGRHGDLEAALKPLQRAAELSPQAPQMQYNLALTYFQLQRFEEARAALAEPAKHWPDLFPISNLYGATLLKLGDDLAAYQALSRAHRLNPADQGTSEMLYLATLNTARKQQTDKNYPEALRLLQEAVALLPQEAAPHQAMSEIFSLTGQSQRAIEEQKEAQRLTKDSGKLP